jgi:DNA-binding response OmpR family regulator
MEVAVSLAMSQAGSLLLIDDEPQVVDLLRDFFEEQGYSVMSALSGRDALVLASLTRPDAVLLDIRMPELQGPEVLRALHELDASISVVMVSGADDEDLARELLRAGAFDYVRKPFLFDHLETVVRMATLVGRRQPLREPEAPRPLEPWALGENEPDDDVVWCARCQGPLAGGDTSAVRERGAKYHAACWLTRTAERSGAGAQLAGR